MIEEKWDKEKRKEVIGYFRSLSVYGEDAISKQIAGISDPKKILSLAETQLIDRQVDIFIPLIPDIRRSKNVEEGVQWLSKSFHLYKPLIDAYKNLGKFPTFVFPHYRGTILCGKRGTGILISNRVKDNALKFDDDQIYSFIELFQRVYERFFGVGNTITEKILKMVESPNSLLRQISKLIIVVVEFASHKNELIMEESDNSVIVALKFSQEFCESLEDGHKLFSIFTDFVKKDVSRLTPKNKEEIAGEIILLLKDLLRDLRSNRDFLRVTMSRDPEGKQFLTNLYSFFTSGVIKNGEKVDQLSDAQLAEIDSILIAVQALLIYSEIFWKNNNTIGLFYIPLRAEEVVSLYPRCTAAAFWEMEVTHEELDTFGEIFQAGYYRLQGIVEKKLQEIAVTGAKSMTQLGKNVLGIAYKPFQEHIESEKLQLLEPYYLLMLALCEELSADAKHEGEVLQFVMILGRDYHLDTYLTGLYQIPKDKQFGIDLLPENEQLNRVAIDETISRIKGHYAFLTGGNVGLFAICEYEEGAERITFSNFVLPVLKMPGEYGPLASYFPDSTGVSPMRLLNSITSTQKELLGVVVSGDRTVRASHGGNELLEYRGGKWTFIPEGFNKSAHDLSKKLKEKFKQKWEKQNSGLIDRRLKLLTDTIRNIYLSPLKGATFVLGDYKKLTEIGTCTPITDLLDYVEGRDLLDPSDPESSTLLYQLAIMDGATIVDTESFEVYGRRQLQPFNWRDLGFLKKWISKGSLQWPGYHRVHRWGMRHLSALGSTANEEATGPIIAIVLSSDGPVSVFEGGRGIDDLTYPREKQK